MHLRLVLTYLLYNLFNTKKYLALALKKIVHLLFCVLQTKLNKAFNIFCRLLEQIRNVQVIPGFSTKDLDENLAWLTEKTEDFQVTPLSSKTFCAPQVTQFSEGPTTTPFNKRGEWFKLWKSLGLFNFVYQNRYTKFQ